MFETFNIILVVLIISILHTTSYWNLIINIPGKLISHWQQLLYIFSSLTLTSSGRKEIETKWFKELLHRCRRRIQNPAKYLRQRFLKKTANNLTPLTVFARSLIPEVQLGSLCLLMMNTTKQKSVSSNSSSSLSFNISLSASVEVEFNFNVLQTSSSMRLLIFYGQCERKTK